MQAVEYRCPHCGGACVEYMAGKYRCGFCGSEIQFADRPTDDDVRKLNDANTARDNYDFAKASEICADILSGNVSNSEANWCALLSQYSIVYSQNNEHKYVPTFLRADGNETPLPQSKYYAFLSAARKSEADAIEKMRQNVVKAAAETPPYDVFICYKQHEDSDGRLTEESQWAQSLYHRLNNEGFRVFFDEECLKGSNVGWEPHIYAALSSAKFMIVLGSSLEHINSRWVKNEWKRFILQKRYDSDKTVAVLGLNIDPYRLPDDEMRAGQMVNATDGDWIETLVNRARAACIKTPQLNRREYAPQTLGKKAVVKTQIVKRKFNVYAQTAVTATEKGMLNAAKQFLQSGDYSAAEEYGKQAIALNASNSEAYWLLFLAENKSKDSEAFKEQCRSGIKDMEGFRAAIASGNAEQRNMYYEILFDWTMCTCSVELFEEYISLPDSSQQQIAKLTAALYQAAKNSKSVDTFDSVIKTVSDTDLYISMNVEFAGILFESNPGKAKRYYKNVLDVDESNETALYKYFIIDKCLLIPETFAEYCLDFPTARLWKVFTLTDST